MPDPFSILTATVGLIDVCVRFGCYLRDVSAGAAKIEEEIRTLSRDIDGLKIVNQTIQASYQELPGYLNSEIESSKRVERLWRNVSSNLESCQLIVEELEALVKGIIGKEPPKDESKISESKSSESKISRKLGGFMKQLRKQSREGDFHKLRSRLTTHYNTIQLMLDLIIWSVDVFVGRGQG